MDTHEPIYAPIGYSCCASVSEYAHGEVYGATHVSQLGSRFGSIAFVKLQAALLRTTVVSRKNESECRDVLDSGTKIAERSYCEQSIASV